MTSWKIYLWRFPEGAPENGWFTREIPIKVDEFGGTPIYDQKSSKVLDTLQWSPEPNCKILEMPVCITKTTVSSWPSQVGFMIGTMPDMKTAPCDRCEPEQMRQGVAVLPARDVCIFSEHPETTVF